MMNSLSLSMITKNAARFLPACLASARTIVDEIVIADTGSTDDSIAVAVSLGARVISIAWNDDFAAARNLALAEVHTDWVLVLDADEQLDDRAARQIPVLLTTRNVDAFQVTIRNYVATLEERIWDRPAKLNDFFLPRSRPYPAYVEHQNVRLFRRHPAIYFLGRVHESVGPRVTETGRHLAEATFLIHHFGLVADAGTRAEKNLFYRRLGRQKIREMAGNAQAHLELGLVELDNFQNLPEALALFQRACQLNPRLGVASFFLGLTLFKLNRFAEALQPLAEAERHGHRTALVAETIADAHYNLKNYQRAAAHYSRARKLDPQNPQLQSKLGLANLRFGLVDSGLEQLCSAIAAKPSAPELRDRLVLALVFLNRIADAADAAEAKLSAMATPAPPDFLRTASLHARCKNLARAVVILQSGLRLYPHETILMRALSETLAATPSPSTSPMESTSLGG